jgi:pimeloyl-ACP methyl ester carboxylesterase
MLLALGIVLSAWAGTIAARPVEPPPRDAVELAVPLHEGRVRVADLLEAVLRAGGVPEEHGAFAVLEQLDWSVQVVPRARRELRAVNRLAGGSLHLRVEGEHLVVTIDRAAAEALRARIDESLEAWGRQLTSAIRGPRRPPGVSLVQAPGVEIPLGGASAAPQRLVLLVHGLDEPGWIFDDVIAALAEAGLATGVFEYPNDGPIGEATDLLALEMEALRRRGTERVDMVAHSMGGLVARDLLTRPAYYGGEGSMSERFPAVDRLIMVGTPNHGSELARLRALGEWREQIVRLFRDGSWAETMEDGAGEAAVDLLPDSDFLRRLNGRPLPSHTRLTIIAGRMLPVDREGAREMLDSLARAARRAEWSGSPGARRLLALVGGLADGLGDGLVTLDSARLAGVEDFVVVDGNHHSMLHDLVSSDEPPPSVPIIMERVMGEE